MNVSSSDRVNYDMQHICPTFFESVLSRPSSLATYFGTKKVETYCTEETDQTYLFAMQTNRSWHFTLELEFSSFKHDWL